MPNLLGFTGTRQAAQPAAFRWLDAPETHEWFESYDGYVTGGCRGFDVLVGQHLADTFPDKEHWVICPSNKSQIFAWWLAPEYEFVRVVYMPEGTDYRDRNTEIVNRSAELYYCADFPEADGRSKRSGTWMTVRIAQNAEVPVTGMILHSQEETV